jgi:hypothetical protein
MVDSARVIIKGLVLPHRLRPTVPPRESSNTVGSAPGARVALNIHAPIRGNPALFGGKNTRLYCINATNLLQISIIFSAK